MSYLDTRRQHILNDRPPVEKKWKRPNAVSDKRKEENELYKVVSKEYLKQHKFCECGCGRKATEIHHMRGRIGDLLCDTKYFKAVASSCHRAIELNPKDAKQKGLSVSRLKK